MPELDFAMICDHVRVENGLGYVIGGGMDTVSASSVPTAQGLGLFIRLRLTRNECDRPHRIEVIFQDEDGARLTQIAAVLVATYPEDAPPGGFVGAVTGINFPLPLPRYGDYSFEILVNDSSSRSLPLRVARLVLPPQSS